MATLTSTEADEILELIGGRNHPLYRKMDEIICAIQGGEEIDYIDEDAE